MSFAFGIFSVRRTILVYFFRLDGPVWSPYGKMGRANSITNIRGKL